MSRHHVEAVFDQFPWLNNHFARFKRSFEEAAVSRIDEKVLELRAGTVIDRFFGPWRERLYIFDQNGVLLSRVHGNSWISRIRDFCWMIDPFGSSSCFGPEERSVREALIKLGEKAIECLYIIRLEDHWKIVVFREPKEGTIVDLLRKKAEQDLIDTRLAREEIACS